MARRRKYPECFRGSERFVSAQPMVRYCDSAGASNRHNGRTKFPTAHNFRLRILKMEKENCRAAASVAVSRGWQAERLPYKKWERPTQLTFTAMIAICSLLACETTNYAPPIKPTARNRSQLDHGRTLFAHRCIECHVLPQMWKYSREDWPQIVNDMSHRASLKADERDAVIAYILAVRSRK